MTQLNDPSTVRDQSGFNLPTLMSVTDEAGNIQQKWEVSGQNYTWNNAQRTYTTAQLTLTSYSPLNTVSVYKTSTTYDDIAGTISMSTAPRNGYAALSQTNISFVPSSLASNYDVTDLSLMDVINTTVNVSGNYLCVTDSKNVPVKTFKSNVFTSVINEITDGNGIRTNYTYDKLRRIVNVDEAVIVGGGRSTTYKYGTLNDGTTANPYSTPTTIYGPYQTIINTLNANGQILTQTVAPTQRLEWGQYPSPIGGGGFGGFGTSSTDSSSTQTTNSTTFNQPGSTSKTLLYTYYDVPNQPNYGLLKTVDGPRPDSDVNDKTTYTYDNWGNLVSKVSAVNNHAWIAQTRTQTYAGYNSAGLPSTINYANGLTDQISYDSGYRVVQTIHGNGTESQTTSSTYDTLGRLATSTDADGDITQYTYDVLGRLVKTTQPNGTTENYAYHPNNTLLSKIQKSSTGVIAGSQWQDINPTGQVNYTRSGGDDTKQWVLISYDANNNVTQTQTALGIINKWTYDALNRVTSHTDGNGQVDNKGFDNVDNEILTSAPNTSKSDRTFINQSLLQQEINTDYGTTNYTYDVAENLTGTVHNGRNCINTAIDQLGRANYVNCTLSGSSDVTYQARHSYTYDPVTDNLNQVTTQLSNGVITAYGYDGLGRLTSKTQRNKILQTQGLPIATLNNGYSYTTGGKLTQFTYPSGKVISYNYDATDGDLDSIDVNGVRVARVITFDAAGHFRSLYWGASSSLRLNMGVDDGGEITSILSVDSTNVPTFSTSNDYDKDGRLLKQNYPSSSESYTYDNKSQLLTDTINGSVITYTYDTNGNRLTLRTTSGAGLGYTYQGLTYTNNRLTGWTKGSATIQPTSAVTGEATTAFIGGTTIGTGSYDAMGRRRTEANPNSTIYMDYNHKNERTLRQGQGVAQDRQYAYDESSHLIGEYDINGTVIVEYVWMGDRPIAALYPDNSIVYIVSDHQNKPRRGISASTRTVVWSWDPDAFGALKPATIQNGVTINLRFPGQYYDSTTGLYYNHHRFYNPEIGRYMEPDPTGLDAGLNPYAYTDNNPVNNVDPSGLDWMVPSGTSEFGGIFYQGYNESYSSGNSCLANADYNNFTYISGATGSYSSVIGERALENTYPEFAVMGVSSVVRAGVGAVVNTLSSTSASTASILSAAATRAANTVGSGSGPVYGTSVHTAFKQEVLGLGNSNLTPEVSYLNGKVVQYGTKGSVRPDVVEGPIDLPTALFDLKTGSATLPASKIQQILSHMPPGSKNIPISVIRP